MRPQIICLDPARPGRTAEVAFTVRGTGGLCSELSAAPDLLFFDDLLVTNDPACP